MSTWKGIFQYQTILYRRVIPSRLKVDNQIVGIKAEQTFLPVVQHCQRPEETVSKVGIKYYKHHAV
jgi:hypothetical protein